MYLPNQQRCTRIDFRPKFRCKGGLLHRGSAEWIDNSSVKNTLEGKGLDLVLEPSQHYFWRLEWCHSRGGHLKQLAFRSVRAAQPRCVRVT